MSSNISISPPTSKAARKRRRVGLSQREIFTISEGDDEKTIKDHSADFAPDSTVHYTWGMPITAGFSAPQRTRRRRGLYSLGFRRDRQSGFEKFMFGERVPEPFGPNSPERSGLLRVPLEIRWRVYENLLVQQKPILLHHDCATVHGVFLGESNVLMVCKQISLEASSFLYEKNVFQILVRKSFLPPLCHRIHPRYLPLLRNVIISCERDVRSRRWCKTTTDCLQTLIKAQTALDSLTLSFAPQSIRGSQMVGGSEGSSVTFADWFRPHSPFISAVMSLRCKVLNIVMRLPEKKRVVISLNLRHAPVNLNRGGWFAKDEVTRRTRFPLAIEARDEMRALKTRFEHVFEDHEAVITEGKARLMGEGETLGDGMRLAYLPTRK
ncbi:MAG: hypothetical protein M1818_003880 [Claussenomyces sp. TS43310]|nr:MAG: hypothetical protein M1818_003880 [Claussenomyces sp. TS43310]